MQNMGGSPQGDIGTVFLASTEPEPEPESEPEPKKQYPDRVNRVANRSSKCPQTYATGALGGGMWRHRDTKAILS